MKKRKRKLLCLLMALALYLSCMGDIMNVRAFTFVGVKLFTVYKGGSFTGTNNGTGAINKYVLTESLLTDTSRVEVTVTDSKGNSSSYMWVAKSEYAENDGYVVGKSFLKTIETDGMSITYKVLNGGVAVKWPDGNPDMPFSYFEGEQEAEDDPWEGTESGQSLEEVQSILDQLNLEGLFKDGKFVLFASKLISTDEYGKNLTDKSWEVFSQFFKNGFCLLDNGLPIAVDAKIIDGGNIKIRMAFPSSYGKESDNTDAFAELFTSEPEWDEYKNKIDMIWTA